MRDRWKEIIGMEMESISLRMEIYTWENGKMIHLMGMERIYSDRKKRYT